MSPVATTQGSPGVDPGLLSRFEHVSRSEAVRMLQFLDKIRNDGSACEDLVGKLAIEDEPGLVETTQSPCSSPGRYGDEIMRES